MGCGSSTNKKNVYDHSINLDLNEVVQTTEHVTADYDSIESHGGEIVLSSPSKHSSTIETYSVTVNAESEQHAQGATTGRPAGAPAPPLAQMKDKKQQRSRKAVFSRSFNTKDKSPVTKTKTTKTDDQVDMLMTKMAACYLFSDLAEEDREEMISYMSREKVRVGSTIVTQGKKADNFFIIESGTFEAAANGKVVSTRNGESAEPFFGASALLFNSKSDATIRCVSSGNDGDGADSTKNGKYGYVWAIDRVTFRHVITSHLLQNRDEFLAAVEGIPMLAEYLTSEQLDRLVDAMEMVRVKSGQSIIKKGDYGSVVYFIKSGGVICSNIGEQGLGQIELGPGSYFGERALLTEEPRAADVTTTKDSVLLCLGKKSFNELLGSLRSIMDETMKERVVEAVPILQQLPKGVRKKVTSQFEVVSFEDREPIVVEGDIGDRFFLVRSGCVDVYSAELLNASEASESTSDSGSDPETSPARSSRSRAARRRPSALVASTSSNQKTFPNPDEYGIRIASLKQGDWFGEMALLNNEPRSATCVANGPVECFALSNDAFKLISKKSELLVNTSARRLEENRSKRLSYSVLEYTKLTLKDLNKIKILGKGTFGTVFLVESNNRSPVKGVWALKAMNKGHIVECDQTRNVVNEKNVLQELRHPFILQLYTTFQDRDSIYMLLDFVQGGELFSIMQQHYRLPLAHAQFYAACIVDALDYMHSLSFVYRDLKPENVLIDSQGFIKIADFGFAKKISGKTFTLCGTPEYLSPEIILSKGHDKGVDYWAVGILIYEMLAGISPFADEYTDDQIVVCKQIVSGKVNYERLENAIRETELHPPTSFSEQEINYVFNRRPFEKKERKNSTHSALTTARRPSMNSRPVEHLIRKLLVKSPHQRLGCLKDGAQDIKRHAFFGIDSNAWQDLRSRSWIPPFVPKVSSRIDASNFDDFEPDARWDQYVGSNDWCRDF